jgi:thioesterase domain-containing protein
LGLSQTFTRFAIGLANVYGDECPPVFAFRASGFAIGEPLFQSIETIAEEYIFQMKQLQPTGPYQLLGYSFGGLVAYEMARQLQQKHRATVRSLILIDPPVPALEKLTVPDGIDKYPFWSLKTIGFIQQYLMKDKTSLAVLQDASMSEGERTRILQHLQNNVVEKINDRFSPVKKSLNRSSNNHTIAKNMCEVIQAHIIAQESYLYEAAKHSSGSFLVQRAILFTLKHHNPNVSREIKEQTWQSLIPDLIIEQLDGTHDILLEATTADIIIEQLKARTIL